MKTPLQVGLGLAFLGIVGALSYGLVTPEQVVPGQHVRIPWSDGGAPAGSRCAEFDGLASDEARALFGLAAGGGERYCRLRVGASEADAGAEFPTIPEGMTALDPWYVVSDQPCPYQVEVWCDYGATPGMTGACAPATPEGEPLPGDCEALLADGGWGPAPVRVHFPAGTWRGGCVRKPSGEIAGHTSWPPECGPESLP